MSKHIAIYTTDKKYAKDIIDSLISKDPTKKVTKYVMNSRDIKVGLDDGSYYHSVSPNQNARGIKPDIAYVDIDTCSFDIIQNIIFIIINKFLYHKYKPPSKKLYSKT